MTVPAKWKGKRLVIRTTLIDDFNEKILRPQEEWFVKDKLGWISAVENATAHEKGRSVP